jgi:phosphopantothenoylcysteine synthetase/decarboxylase
MTEAAARFVSPVLMQAYAAEAPIVGKFHSERQAADVVDGIDAYVVLPASAHTLACIAFGDPVHAVVEAALRVTCPILIVPSMNTAMWNNRATQDNVGRLKARGISILDPVMGFEVSTMTAGIGAMPSIEAIAERLCSLLELAKVPRIV